MNPIRIACLAFLAGACLPIVQAQSDTPRIAAASGSRMEVLEIYEEGKQRLAPRWHGLRMLDGAAVFIRKEMPKGEKGRVDVWLHRELAAPQYHEKEKSYLSVRERFMADCGARRLGLAEWVYYAGRFGEGQVIKRANTEQPELNSALPDSLEEQVLSIACPIKQRKVFAKAKKPPKPKAES